MGFVKLDQARSLNAIDLEMFCALEKKLLVWRETDQIACVVLHSDSEKAFSAGGDVKALAIALGQSHDLAPAREFFTAEYFVDYLIHIYPKPILCWADGITMGGGIGIMNGASYRVVTERSLLATPEMTIGLFPDVGGTYFLNRMPAGVGLFLGLTGARFTSFDRSDFQEGVRARLIDKNNQPRWNPPILSAVQPQDVAALFSQQHGYSNLLFPKTAEEKIL